MMLSEKNHFDVNENILWWEKTVEYSYVIKYIPKVALVVPLDGKHEAAGDALFAHIDKWYVVEFKRTKNSSSEDAKYSPEGAKKAHELRMKYHEINDNAPHFIVYGAELVNNKLSLEAKRYWSEKEVPISDLSLMGVDFTTFKKYITEVIEAKKGENGGAVSGFGSIVGVGSDGINTTTTIAEFAKCALNRNLVLEHKNHLRDIQKRLSKSKSLGR